jgi:hypothetical protein
VSGSLPEFESFRAELQSLLAAISVLRSRTLRDQDLQERFRTLLRVWVSSVEPNVKRLAGTTREVFKLAAEIEKLAQLASKYRSLSQYKLRLRNAIHLADTVVLFLPIQPQRAPNLTRDEPFISSIPDLPSSLVPNPILGWKSRMEAFLRDHPFDKSVFLMIRYRQRNAVLIDAIKSALHLEGLFVVVASEHSITDDLYNPIACLLCCARGIAVFDRAEQGQDFNPNVAYELGMLHLLGRKCLILKHDTLRTLQTDILMKLYQSFAGPRAVASHAARWAKALAD